MRFHSGVIALLLVPMVLTSCITGLRRKPAVVENVPSEKREGKVSQKQPAIHKKTVSVKQRKKAVRQVRSGVKKYGEVTDNSVNIRAGANLNYEILGKLKKGVRIAILDSAYGWHEIVLPEDCVVWIYKDYVSTRVIPSAGKRAAGVVTGDSVRIRAKPGLKCTVLSKADKGDRVNVVDSKGDWIAIEAPDSCTGWVFADYVKIPKK